MFMRFKSMMTSTGIVRGCRWLAAHHLVQIEGDALAVAHRVHHHERLTHEPSWTISPAAKKFVSPRRPNLSILMVPRSVLNFVRQPFDRCALSDSDDHVVNMKTLGLGLSINRDGRGIDRSRKARWMQLQGFDLAVAEHGSHGSPVHQLHTFFQHVRGDLPTRPAFPEDWPPP
jgi:hypothetical protein